MRVKIFLAEEVAFTEFGWCDSSKIVQIYSAYSEDLGGFIIACDTVIDSRFTIIDRAFKKEEDANILAEQFSKIIFGDDISNAFPEIFIN